MTCRSCGESLFWRPVDLRPGDGWWQCAQRHIWRLREGRLVADHPASPNGRSPAT